MAGEQLGSGGAFVAGHHRPEVGEASTDHLHEVDPEEDQEADRRGEVHTPRRLVATECRGQERQLRRGEDREPTHDDRHAQEQHTAVGDPLGGVVSAGLWWGRLAEVQVVSHHGTDLSEVAGRRDDLSPVTRAPQVHAVGDAVEGEEPPEGEVERHAPGETTLEPEVLVEPVGEEVEPMPADQPDAHAVGVAQVGPVDTQARPDHDREQWEVDPVHPARRAGVFADEDHLVVTR